LLFQRRQPVHCFLGVHAHSDDALEQVQDMLRIVVFARPIFRVVHDPAVLVLAKLVAVHDPLDGGLAVADDDTDVFDHLLRHADWRES